MIKQNRSAFTLAEMMIVMLILTILLAAFAPLMTRKAKVDLSNPWRWANNNSDIYYGMGNNQTALIGQNGKVATDPNAKLLINSTNGRTSPHITFKEGNNVQGHMLYRGSNLFIGSAQDDDSNVIFPAFGSGTNNIGIGFNALRDHNESGGNIAIGTNAMKTPTRGGSNIAIGSNAMGDSESYGSNIAIGSNALKNLNSGADANIMLGSARSLSTFDFGDLKPKRNIFILPHETWAWSSDEESSDNIIFGFDAFMNYTYSENKKTLSNPNVAKSYQNVAIGDEALKYAGGKIKRNVVIGHRAGEQIDKDYNVAIGGDSLKFGSESNTAIGGFACHNQKGKNNICVGYKAGHKGTDGLSVEESNRIYIGNSSNNAIYIAGRDVTSILGISDKRLKNIKGENNDGLGKIKQLKAYNYTYKNGDKEEHVGIIAQDLQKIFPKAVTKDDRGYLRIRQEDMFYASINAIKELDKMLQDLIAQVKTVVAQVANHDTQIKALQKENKELKNKVQTLEKQNKSFEARLKAIEKKL